MEDVLKPGSFQEVITVQGVGCVAGVMSLSSGMTFLSSNPAPPPSSRVHYLAPLRLSFLICQMKVITTVISR